MGRGRAKAKQTKVARKLKYSSGGTDLERLQAELSGNGSDPVPEPVDEVEADDDYDDPYADVYGGGDDDDDDAATR